MTGHRRGGALASPALALVVAAIVIGLLDVVAVPVLLREQATDWRAYEGAAELLARGEPLYGWTVDPDIRATTDYPYIYPPPLAAIWGWGLTPMVFAALKVASLTALVAFVGVATTRRPIGGLAVAGGVSLALLTVATPGVVHALILGNVMTLYVAATALVLALPRQAWAGAPLGILVAVALKPAIVPVLVWMLLRRRGQFLAALVGGLVTTAIFAAIVGVGPFIDYLLALPKLGGLAQPFTGNLGLSAISLGLAVVAIPASILYVTVVTRFLDPWASAAVAVGMTFLAQPTLGLNYAGLLVPGVVALWLVRREAAVVLAALLPIVAIVSPPLAGVVLAVTATLVGRRRPDDVGALPEPADPAATR